MRPRSIALGTALMMVSIGLALVPSASSNHGSPVCVPVSGTSDGVVCADAWVHEYAALPHVFFGGADVWGNVPGIGEYKDSLVLQGGCQGLAAWSCGESERYSNVVSVYWVKATACPYVDVNDVVIFPEGVACALDVDAK